jgi:hypothetical protein
VAKGKNIVKTESVTVAISAQVYATLLKFTKTGYAGKNVAETAAQMISSGIDASTRGDSLLATAFKESSKKRR